MRGHDVTVYDARPKAGGLNEYGIAAYKTAGGFAQSEVDWLLGIGGIRVEPGRAVGRDLTLSALRDGFDAVFLGLGLSGVNALGLEGEAALEGPANAVDFIAALRQAGDLTELPVGRHVVVIGGGMTAVDAAVQSKLLGAETVTIAYRRGRERMPASRWEQDLAASHGVRLMFGVAPAALHGEGRLREVELAYLGEDMAPTGETVRLRADQMLRAIGQTLETVEGLALDGRKIAVSGAGRTSVEGVWAGGDCAAGGEDLTVTAVAEGRDAAEDIHRALAP
jgi:glutamate synthase (NADPH/NADH) small chain